MVIIVAQKSITDHGACHYANQIKLITKFSYFSGMMIRGWSQDILAKTSSLRTSDKLIEDLD